MKVLSIDSASRILDGIKDEVHIYEDSASRILDGIKDEVHIYMKIVPQGYWTESRMKSIYMKIYLPYALVLNDNSYGASSALNLI